MNPNQQRLVSEAKSHSVNGTGKKIREAAGLSCADIAAAIGVDQSAVWRWERGLRAPRQAQAVKWARLLAKLDRHNCRVSAATGQ